MYCFSVEYNVLQRLNTKLITAVDQVEVAFINFNGETSFRGFFFPEMKRGVGQLGFFVGISFLGRIFPKRYFQ